MKTELSEDMPCNLCEIWEWVLIEGSLKTNVVGHTSFFIFHINLDILESCAAAWTGNSRTGQYNLPGFRVRQRVIYPFRNSDIINLPYYKVNMNLNICKKHLILVLQTQWTVGQCSLLNRTTWKREVTICIGKVIMSTLKRWWKECWSPKKIQMSP